ncbi:dihydrolipoamide acetyltransferase family protein [Ochrobactrum sp. WV_118_8]|uniref:Dihydrolipoamide acetyltransferase component of pyruvate dehydrogenase complex n=1 Tax=Brucella anthropi TaxID=529 RepID=A0A6L3Z3C6_BRUAN|nr:dihydrolipoamide acetyltransferase family protein [Brucella anthropi]QOD65446.1 2-oxo acid dehydrogenase subunit E2 [Ochrobactrum sp. MT180101]KAB2767141.1 2-oxo acid dehydrogenase subunit E2 [Brucella anthropi]KAB2786370.1 2-oxo acid dehydrogenase subunit E2 [Brucella anthropi]MCR8491334.1 2-oxo acid dehydrogenase subunit E2 [Brucella anthropi]UVV70420.1 2-oxo acid dehydrogenase subunit E2 [Brucella anthropi]
MAHFTIKLPDVGEGVAEAELVEWHVKVGDVVREDDLLAAVMTDKATVEIPSSRGGKVIAVNGEVGEKIAVGSELVRLEIEGGATEEKSEGNAEEPAPTAVETAKPQPAPTPETPVLLQTPVPPKAAAPKREATSRAFSGAGPIRSEGERPLATPSVRLRARDAGVDLRRVRGTGPAGRITHEDLDVFFQQETGASPALSGYATDTSVNEIKVIGLRRKIAERMAEAKRHIPHITIVEEVDVTQLEELRSGLNNEKKEDRPRLTLLPFIIRTIVKAVKEQPGLNAHFDDEADIIRQFGGVHIGIATQTPNGLIVPVVRHAESMSVFAAASELSRVTDAARNGTAKREELTGSTITITSLGPLGAIATTPIINRPEVAIIGINKMAVRPMWDGVQFVPRKMMNLSCSFDHRVIDGWDAAVFVQKLKSLLETPAMIFVEG